jgi:hypothetical protein
MTTMIQKADAHQFVRRALLADALASAATGILLAAGAELLTGWLGLPASLMRYAGLSLLPFAAIVLFVGLRQAPPRAAVLAIIAYNALWTIDSLVLLASGWVAPTLFGFAFVMTQAVTVGALAMLQWIGVKRADHGRH